MRVLIVVDRFPSSYQVGAEWRAYNTARGKGSAMHEVQVVCVESAAYSNGQVLERTQAICGGARVHPHAPLKALSEWPGISPIYAALGAKQLV